MADLVLGLAGGVALGMLLTAIFYSHQTAIIKAQLDELERAFDAYLAIGSIRPPSLMARNFQDNIEAARAELEQLRHECDEARAGKE